MTTVTIAKSNIDGPHALEDDEVVRLREWGTDNVCLLPRYSTMRCTIGASVGCAIHLVDPWRRISRVHAELVCERGQWLLRDQQSKNGVLLNDARTTEVWLQAGDEITMGCVTLVAESRRWIELRSYMSRLLGWDGRLGEVVDLALRSVRMANAGSGAIVLCGEDDLVPIARSLHRRMRGNDRPFIVCDPARCLLDLNSSRPETYDLGMPALDAAIGGTLCVRHERLPFDFPDVAAVLWQPQTQVQLMVCARSTRHAARYISSPIAIPTLGERLHELDRIIDEYIRDAFEQLHLEPSGLPREDRAWVRRHASSCIAAIQKATFRLAALRGYDSVEVAASRIGMTPRSLAQWLERRKIPMHTSSLCYSAN
jgi:FHA domain